MLRDLYVKSILCLSMLIVLVSVKVRNNMVNIAKKIDTWVDNSKLPGFIKNSKNVWKDKILLANSTIEKDTLKSTNSLSLPVHVALVAFLGVMIYSSWQLLKLLKVYKDGLSGILLPIIPNESITSIVVFFVVLGISVLVSKMAKSEYSYQDYIHVIYIVTISLVLGLVNRLALLGYNKMKTIF